MNSRKTSIILLLAVTAGSVPDVRADGKVTAARELAEWVVRKFSGKVAGEGVESLTRRIATVSARYGDDVVRAAVQKVGPKALTLADDAAAHAPQVLKFIAKFGDEGAALLTRKSAKLLALGDNAARVLLTHKGVSEPLLERFGASGVRALASVSPRSGRRIAMLGNGLLGGTRANDVMEVIARHGDRAATFIWEHKGALAVGTTLAAFLANPQPFIDGTKQLAETVTEKAVVPVANSVINGGVKIVDTVARSTVEPIAREAAKALPWTELSLLGVGILGVLATLGLSRWERRRRVTAELS